VTGISSIGLDHVKTLGGSVESIAYEKACIAKPGAPMVLYAGADPQTTAIVREQCDLAKTTLLNLTPLSLSNVVYTPTGSLFDADFGESLGFATQPMPDMEIRLPGAHQVGNALTALAMLMVYRRKDPRVTLQAIRLGLEGALWPCRLEWGAPGVYRQPGEQHYEDWGPTFLLDGCHNPQGIQALGAFLRSLAIDTQVTMVFGMINTKDVETCAQAVKALPRVENIVVTAPVSDHPTPAGEMAALLEGAAAAVYWDEHPAAALARAANLAGTDGLVLVAGSLYLVGYARTLLDWPPCALLREEIRSYASSMASAYRM